MIMIKTIGMFVGNIVKGLKPLVGGSFGERLGNSLKMLLNIKIATDHDIRAHAPDLRVAAKEIARAMKDIRITAGIDDDTRKLCADVLQNAEELIRVVDRFGQHLESGMTDFGLNHGKAATETIFGHFNFYLATAVFLSFSICVVNKEESWARSTMSVLALTVVITFFYYTLSRGITSSKPDASPSDRDHTASSSASPPAATPESPDQSPGGLQSRQLIDKLSPSSFTSPQAPDNFTADKVSFHTKGHFRPCDSYHNTFVVVDLEEPHLCNKFELGGPGDWNEYVTGVEIHFKVNKSDPYTVLSPHNGNAHQQFVGLDHDKQHKTYENFDPFTARYVKIVPREYKNVPSFKFEISGVPVKF